MIKGDLGDEDMTEEQLQLIISLLDENGDGEVDFDEFTHWWCAAAAWGTRPALQPTWQGRRCGAIAVRILCDAQAVGGAEHGAGLQAGSGRRRRQPR